MMTLKQSKQADGGLENVEIAAVVLVALGFSKWADTGAFPVHGVAVGMALLLLVALLNRRSRRLSEQESQSWER